MQASDAPDGRGEVAGQHDVRIDVAEQRSGSMLFRLAKKIVEKGCAEFVARHFWKMANTKLARDFHRPFLLAE
jgi:hypothetical protein